MTSSGHFISSAYAPVSDGSPSMQQPSQFSNQGYPSQPRQQPVRADHMMRPSEDHPYSGMSQDLSDGLSIHSRTNLQYPIATPPQQHDFAFSNQDYVKPGARSASRASYTALNEKTENIRPPLSTQNTGFSRPSSPRNTKSAYGVKGPYGVLGAGRDSTDQLTFAQGDYATGKAGRFYLKMISSNIFIRWTFFIVPIMALLWIPGIVGLTAAPDAGIWGAPLLWWSIWLSVLWGGWWACLAGAMMLPHILQYSIGTIAPELKHYIAYLQNIKRFVAFASWALLNWILFNQFVLKKGPADRSTGGGHILSGITQAWFGIFISACILLGEKLLIQVIARNFHKKSYEDRIVVQKQQLRFLTVLYVNSRDIGRTDTLDGAGARSGSPNPSKIFKSALKGVRRVAQTGATALGTVASEIAGERVLQPNSPASMVSNAISSANKSKQLARRIFWSFVPRGRQSLQLQDITHMFPSREEAEGAFAMFDADENGDASLEECEMATMDVHRERLALASSMRDLDSAVGRLDAIMMTVWYVVALIVVVGMISASFSTFIASAGTLVLGLSWLIGVTAQEILASIIFLFVKHAYDVGDRVDIDDNKYVVKEMHLLFSVFRGIDGRIIQIPHSVLNTKVICNLRRSGAISETFTFDVDFSTSFDKIEALREKMLDFLERERRDFHPAFDVVVDDIAGQGKLTLSADIMFKTNWQNNALKYQRRNKWICALKIALASLEIWGPDGAGNPSPAEAGPTVIKMLPPAEAAPPYRSQTSSSNSDPESSREEPVRSPVESSVPNLFSDSAAINDTRTNVFDGRGGRRPALDENNIAQVRAQHDMNVMRDQYVAEGSAARPTQKSNQAGDIEMAPRR